MKVSIYNKQKCLPISRSAVSALVKEIISGEKRHCNEIAIHFVETDEICNLHQLYFNDPSPTDCISFPIDFEESNEEDSMDYRLLGDVFVCPKTAIEYARTHCADPYEEAALYIIHGVLHLLGYDDMEETDRALMRRAESKHINRMNELNLSLKPKVGRRTAKR